MPEFNFLFIVFFVIFAAVFIYIIVINTSIIIKKNAEERKNDASPRLTVPAKVAAKRMRVESRRRTHQHMSSIYDRTYYYVTFEFESGDRSEFLLSGEEYGVLAEKDEGQLTFQGTRFISFERNGNL